MVGDGRTQVGVRGVEGKKSHGPTPEVILSGEAMASLGKSIPPSSLSTPLPPVRDSRVDSAAPASMVEETGVGRLDEAEERAALLSSRSMRIARDIRLEAETAELEEDVARLRAERDADADEVAAMLVRVAERERALTASERRASGLEAWTQELEAKVAAARTRGDELEHDVFELRKELAAAKGELAAAEARIAGLESSLAETQRQSEAALAAEQQRRTVEIEALIADREAAVAKARRAAEGEKEEAASAPRALAELAVLLDDLERQETAASAARAALVEEAKRILASEPVTAPPPGPPAAGVQATMPPPKVAKKKPRRPSLPPVARVPSMLSIKTPGVQLETFADLLDADE
jgi:hypothetical protein